jgi:hypothetical protein
MPVFKGNNATELFDATVLPPQGTYRDKYTKVTTSKMHLFGIADTVVATNLTIVSERAVRDWSFGDIITTRKIGTQKYVSSSGSSRISFCDTDEGPPRARLGLPIYCVPIR